MPSNFLILALLLILSCCVSVFGQADLTVPIRCYMCISRIEENDTCNDPIDKRTKNNLLDEECLSGVCVKWTRYIDGKIYLERTCSAKMDMNIMLIDGVCRTESFGNGYLCMCGRNLCNTGISQLKLTQAHMVSLILCLLFTFFWLPWRQ
ncbi:protein quiver-like [Ostrea edulis]|uniref:protein quiver-like n=1 Tax=Ostrea edulis TaxID=37623 RepID=UPI002095B324|nr:protein quiver-like [Ostrea edulis]